MTRIARIRQAIVTISDAMPWVLLPLVAFVLLTTHTATPAPAHVVYGSTPTATASNLVLCESYLSHAAMQSANAVHIPAPQSFCVVGN